MERNSNRAFFVQNSSATVQENKLTDQDFALGFGLVDGAANDYGTPLAGNESPITTDKFLEAEGLQPTGMDGSANFDVRQVFRQQSSTDFIVYILLNSDCRKPDYAEVANFIEEMRPRYSKQFESRQIQVVFWNENTSQQKRLMRLLKASDPSFVMPPVWCTMIVQSFLGPQGTETSAVLRRDISTTGVIKLFDA